MSRTGDELDQRMMALALEVARRGSPSPNPHVGAVIVRDGRVIGLGHHDRAGGPHAEIDALSKLQEEASGATLYVTLEPCKHVGRTGPCCGAILASGIGRVVIGCEDPVRAHAGGANMLRQHGVEVTMGVRRDEAERLVADFRKHACQGLPYVVLASHIGVQEFEVHRVTELAQHVAFDAVLYSAGLVPPIHLGLRGILAEPECVANCTNLEQLLRRLAQEDVVRLLVAADNALADAFRISGFVDEWLDEGANS